MTDIRRFFHDRFILFLLTVNAFLTIVSIAVILLRLGGSQGSYIQSFRSNLGLSSIMIGGVGDIISFALFALGIFAVHIFLAIEFYKLRKVSAWVVMVLTTLLLILNLIVSNALLDLR